MLDIIEKVLKILGRFNCVSNRSQIDRHDKELKKLDQHFIEINKRIYEVYYDKEEVNNRLEKQEAHMKDILEKVEEKALKNEEEIRVNHKMLYEKHQELSDRMQSEVHRNALGIAEVKGMLRGIEGGGSGRGNVRGRVQEGRKWY